MLQLYVMNVTMMSSLANRNLRKNTVRLNTSSYDMVLQNDGKIFEYWKLEESHLKAMVTTTIKSTDIYLITTSYFFINN